MEGSVGALEEGASPSDAQQTLHKDQLALDEVKDKDGWFWSSGSVPPKGVQSAPSQQIDPLRLLYLYVDITTNKYPNANQLH